MNELFRIELLILFQVLTFYLLSSKLLLLLFVILISLEVHRNAANFMCLPSRHESGENYTILQQFH